MIENTQLSPDSQFQETIIRGRSFLRLLSMSKSILVIDQGRYIIVTRDGGDDVIKEASKLGLSLRGIDGFELAKHLRLRIRRRGLSINMAFVALLVMLMIMARAIILGALLLTALVYALMDWPRNKYLVSMDYTYRAKGDPTLTNLVTTELIQSNYRVMRRGLENVNVLVMLRPDNELRNVFETRATRDYGRFLLLKHIKYFIGYKRIENTLKRMNMGEEIYSATILSTAKIEGFMKWGKLYTTYSIMDLLHGGSGIPSLELDLVVLTPHLMPLTNNERGLAIIGKDLEGNYVYWNPTNISPHVAILGPTGSGKTTLAMSIVKQVKTTLGDRIHVIIIDPHGHTTRLKRILNIKSIDMGRLKPAHMDSWSLITAVSFMNPLLALGTEGALIKMALTNNVRSVNDLIKVLNSISSGDLILREAYYNLYNVLSPLIEYYRDGELMSVADLLNGDYVVDLSNVHSKEVVRFITTLILSTLLIRAKMECKQPPCQLRYLVIIDEAHHVLGMSEELSALGVANPLEDIVREIRKFGVSMFILAQPPFNALTAGIMENMGTLIILSGNAQFSSHVASTISGITSDDLVWLTTGPFKALVLVQGRSVPYKLVSTYVTRELI
ncbi:ATP-binding protein [Vulcanisaeta thermophila]|uniref:ATP-binding protein n=1 Tax=Vulcanisaeta thermophila TaxID=867917 RepID=UPI000852A6A3|nr:DUF87 domain-containing protein [Vulcanisaeta thermophila]